MRAFAKHMVVKRIEKNLIQSNESNSDIVKLNDDETLLLTALSKKHFRLVLSRLVTIQNLNKKNRVHETKSWMAVTVLQKTQMERDTFPRPCWKSFIMEPQYQNERHRKGLHTNSTIFPNDRFVHLEEPHHDDRTHSYR